MSARSRNAVARAEARARNRLQRLKATDDAVAKRKRQAAPPLVMGLNGILRPAPDSEEKAAVRLDRAYGHGYNSGYQNGGEPPPPEHDSSDWDKAYDQGYRQGAKDREAEGPPEPDAEEPVEESFEEIVLNKLKEVTDAADTE